LRNILEMQRLLLPLLFPLLLPSASRAQVYSWREGASVKYSSVPPAWYRFDEPARGPRVVVTQGKRVIDDTALSLEQRWRMRPPLRAGAFEASRHPGDSSRHAVPR
jgi:hypothetical protein